MGLVSQIWTISRDDRLRSFLTTNVCSQRFVAHIERLGWLSRVETIHAYFADRADGGCGYEVLWKEDITLKDLFEFFRIL